MPMTSGNMRKAYGHDHEMVDIVVQPPSVIGSSTPIVSTMASAAGVIAELM